RAWCVRCLAGETRSAPKWMPGRLHPAPSDTAARVVLLEDEPLAPGGEKRVQLVLEKPIAAAAGDRFVLRDTSAQRTIGGGRFLDLRATARKRRTPARFAQLDALMLDQPERILAALLAREPGYVELGGFARDHALAADELARIVQALDVIRIAAREQVIGLAPATWLRLTRALTAALAAFHQANPDLPGIGFER